MLDKVKQLREKTSAGMMECKKALSEAGGDMEKAIEILRKKGISLASKRSSRAAKEGLIVSYIHTNNKIGVLLEVNCETDFVARNSDFKNFVKELSMQIAATAPSYISRDDVPGDILEKEKDIIQEQNKTKPAAALQKIIEGKLNSYYQEVCLLEQPYIKDQKIFIKDLLTGLIAKTGENIVVKRFTRYQLGQVA
ncbi:MAG: translation elongation factor Ts [Candidatus Omnitrophica bacterium]|nr:translation elongation factor Ts [Candidatus Omnitrophota bacterium]